MIVRWLGAFRSGGSFKEALNWELTQAPGVRRVVAAERLCKGHSHILHAKVGLLVANRAVVRHFKGDVWSEYNKAGYLVATRKPEQAWSNHTEVWCRPTYLAIVLKAKVSRSTWQTCVEAAHKYNMPILRLCKDGRLQEVTPAHK